MRSISQQMACNVAHVCRTCSSVLLPANCCEEWAIFGRAVQQPTIQASRCTFPALRMIGFPSFHAARRLNCLLVTPTTPWAFANVPQGHFWTWWVCRYSSLRWSILRFDINTHLPLCKRQIEKHLPIKLLNVPWLPGGDCTYFYFKFHNCQSHIHIYWLTYLVLNDFRTLNALYHASLDEHVGVELTILTTRQGFDHNLEQYSLARTQRFV